MAYLKYTSLLIFWGWILSVAYIRYILPFIESALDDVVAKDIKALAKESEKG